VKRRFKWFWIPVALPLSIAVAYAGDRLLLAPTCPVCHTDITNELPLFHPSLEGLVRIRANDMEFRARVAGFNNREGEGVILLHGFPETSIMWETTLDKLAKAGFRAVAFDQRGYSPGARPYRVSSYSSGRLSADVVAIARAVGFDRFHVVGHDFGGAVAWITADRFPREVMSVTSLSMPHPAALAEALDDLRGQRLKSSYALLYRIPVLSELVLGFDRAAYLQHLKWQYHPPEQVEEYKEVFSEPGALRSTLNWYRAFRFRPNEPLGKIRQPTLFIWGNEDGAFGHIAAERTAEYVEGPFRFHVLNAGHNLMLEVPGLVEEELLSHLRTWSQVSERWKLVQAKAVHENAAPCNQSRPNCLNIFVTPNGNAVRIRNRCNEPYQGIVRVSCTGWAPEAFVEYRFSLGAKGDVIQESEGFSFGDCYYSHRLCPMQPQER
jgi:pimeloyl-ACP methyl ester carboxylesterase